MNTRTLYAIGADRKQNNNKKADDRMLINEVIILSHSIHELKGFYLNYLKQTLINENLISFSIKVGSSILTFKEAEKGIKPFYHIAINIPENKIEEAISWIKPEVQLIHNQGSEIVHFEDWNAHSVYFNDPAGNLIELIARHNLNNSSQGSFTESNLICISEIGVPVNNVEEAVQKFSEVGIIPWQNYNSNFAAVGDENGLFIIVSKGRVWFMSDKESFPFDLTINTDVCTVRLDDSNGMTVTSTSDKE